MFGFIRKKNVRKKSLCFFRKKVCVFSEKSLCFFRKKIVFSSKKVCVFSEKNLCFFRKKFVFFQKKVCVFSEKKFVFFQKKVCVFSEKSLCFFPKKFVFLEKSLWFIWKKFVFSWHFRGSVENTSMAPSISRQRQRVAWPSGLRRWFKAPVISMAWVRIPPLPRFYFVAFKDNMRELVHIQYFWWLVLIVNLHRSTRTNE